MPAYQIRPPESSQEWACVRKMLLAYRQEFNDDPCFTSFEEELRDIEALYNKPGKVKLIAVDETDGAVMGCVALRLLSLDIAEMKRLYVDPAFRGRGIGHALVDAILAKARAIGFRQMVLDTSFAMKAAISLYLGLGFTPIEPYNAQDTATVLCLGIDLQPAEH
jgi:N-acetylglutamate synthase-like GNAT family acetyltransferase